MNEEAVLEPSVHFPASMTHEQRMKRQKEYVEFAESMGYEVEGSSCIEGRLWVWRGMEKIVVDFKNWEKPREKFGQAPAVHHVCFVGGKFRYNRHGDDKSMAPDCIEDYGDEKGMALWPKYVVKKDREGNITSHGPAPFGSTAERKEYEKLTGLRHRERGEEKDDDRKQRWRQKKKR